MLTGFRPDLTDDKAGSEPGVNFHGGPNPGALTRPKADSDENAPMEDEVSDLLELTQAWVDERFCPELLPFNELLVNHIIELVKAQTMNVAEQSKKDDVDVAFKLVLYQQEIERAKYVLRSYLRTRIAKIEEQAFFIVESDVMKERLSPLEVDYLEAYSAILESHLTESCLSSLPNPLKKLREQNEQVKMIPEPELDKGVFVKILEELGNVETVPGESIYLAKGDIQLLRYRYIQQFLLQDAVVSSRKRLQLI